MLLSTPVWALAARQGPIRRHKELVFQAVEGLIVLRDERVDKCDDDYKVLKPSDFERNARGLGHFAKECQAGDPAWLKAEGELCANAANDMLETCKEARDMGDPSDPAVQSFWARHRRSSTARVGLHSGTDREGYPDLPGVDRGPRTGRTADAGVTVDPTVAQQSHIRLHKTPKKKNRTGLILDL